MADQRDEILNDTEESFRLILEGWQVKLWTALPGIVTKVDLTKMTCEVQPAIQAIVEDQNGKQSAVNLPLLLDCPILFQGAGNFILTMPLTIGDEVLVIFSSRCIDAWFQSGNVQQAMEARMHDLSDGFVIAGPKSLPNVVSGISATSAQLRNLAGTSYIGIDASGNINLKGTTVNVTGHLAVTGTVSASDFSSGGGVDLATHVHSGVTTGGGTSGPPV